MKRITALFAVAIPSVVWPTIAQILITAGMVVLTYGIEKLVVFIKNKIDKHLAVN